MKVSAAPLTAAQRDLAAAHVGLAEKLAGQFVRRCPLAREFAPSAAALGLCAAALAFDPARGVKFTTYAMTRITGAILDAARMELPQGFRRNKRDNRNKDDVRTVGSLSARIGTGKKALADTVCANELPVGWELESADEVAALARRLPHRHRLALSTFYTRADALTMKRAGRLLGVCESRVSQLLTEAREILGAGPERSRTASAGAQNQRGTFAG